MKKLPLLVLVSSLCLGMLNGCGAGSGTRLEFNKGELYYTSAVTEAEAQKLGNYLVQEEFYDGNPKTVQLNKTGNTYEFRFVVKKEMQQDQNFAETLKAFSSELSSKVFNNAPVDIHICDDQLKTIKVVKAT